MRPKYRLPYFFSKPWVKDCLPKNHTFRERQSQLIFNSWQELIPDVLGDASNHHLLLDPEVICNEATRGSRENPVKPTVTSEKFGRAPGKMWQDLLRLLVYNLPTDRPGGPENQGSLFSLVQYCWWTFFLLRVDERMQSDVRLFGKCVQSCSILLAFWIYFATINLTLVLCYHFLLVGLECLEGWEAAIRRVWCFLYTWFQLSFPLDEICGLSR